MLQDYPANFDIPLCLGILQKGFVNPKDLRRKTIDPNHHGQIN